MVPDKVLGWLNIFGSLSVLVVWQNNNEEKLIFGFIKKVLSSSGWGFTGDSMRMRWTRPLNK